MKINTLHIRNFKNLKNVEFDFSNQRIILFLGETGNGKSSVFDALAYVLTDSLEEKLAEYIRWGQKEFEVDCTFFHLNHTYHMNIICDGKAKKKLIIDDDSNNPFLNSEASKKLAEIIDPVLTKYSAISEQGKSTSLLTDKPGPRLQKLREILKINKVIEAADNIKEDVRVEKEKLDKLQSEIQVLEGLKFIYMDLPLVEDMGKLENEFSLLQEKKKQFDSDILVWNKYNQDLEKYEEAKKRVDTLSENIQDCELGKQKIDIKPIISFNKEEYDNVVSEINKINIDKLKYDQLVKDYKKYLSDRSDYEFQIEELSTKNNDIKLARIKLASHTDEQITEMRGSLNSFIIIKGELSNKLKLLEQGKCPITQEDCIQIISLNKDDIINELDSNQKEAEKLIDEISLASKDKNRFEEETKKQDKLRADKQSIQDKIDIIQKQLDKLIVVPEPEKKDFDIKFNELTTLKNSLEEDKKEAEEIEQYNQKQNLKLNSLETQIKSYQEQISDFILIKKPDEIIEPIFDITNYENVKLKIDLHKQKQDQYNEVVKFNKELKQNEDSTKDKINMLTDSVQKIRSNIRVLEESRNLIEKKFSSYLIEKGTTFLKEKMNAFFQKSYGRYRISLGQDKNSVDFMYSDGIHKETPCGIASGFERQIISVAARVALGKLQNLGILMIDEADSESSEIRSIAMFKMLLEENFNQVFAITHKSNTQEYLSNQPNSGIYEIVNGELV